MAMQFKFYACIAFSSVLIVCFLLDMVLVSLLHLGIRITNLSDREAQPATTLSKNVRVLCMVMTMPSRHQSHAIHVLSTWGKRCTKLMFVSMQNDSSLPILFVNVSVGRKFLTVKHRLAWDYVYRNHFHDFEWFLKVDDDTYVIMENLRHFLSSKDSKIPLFYGQRYIVFAKPKGYHSGGAGYVLSQEALRRFGTRMPGVYSAEISGKDDVVMGIAMQRLGVVFGDSRDERGLERFHHHQPEKYLMGRLARNQFSLTKYPPKEGIDNVSRSAISFHHLSPEHMYNMEYFLYHLQPYGVQKS